MSEFGRGVAVGAALVGLLVLAFAGGVMWDDSPSQQESAASAPDESSGINVSSASGPSAEAEFYEAGAENIAFVTIREMPPDWQSQQYGLWAGCSVIQKFDSPGRYEVKIQKDINVKLVRLGDYRLYGYHDFAPEKPDECPPPEVSSDA